MRLAEYYNFLAHQYPIEDAKYLLGVLFIFYLTLFAFRINGVMKKSHCPRCYGELVRISKRLLDRILLVLMLGILPLRRYRCRQCRHEVLRWNTEKSISLRTKEIKNRQNVR